MEKYDIEKYNEPNYEGNYEMEDAYLRAKKRVEKIKGFYGHLFWYVLVNAFILIMIYRNSGASDNFWDYKNFSTAFFWGIGLFFHFLGTFGTNLFFGKEWEKKQIEKYINKEKKNWE